MIKKIGHRGAAGYAPENTMSSFKKAIELNVDMIELDVYVCKTGEIVVIHDDKVDRTTNGHGYVIEKSLDELLSLDAGNGEKIPMLKEVLDFVDRKLELNIELKGTETAKAVNKLIEYYVKNKAWKYSDFLISSFNHIELKKFKYLSPNIRIAPLISSLPVNYAKFAEEISAFAVNPCSEFINQEFVDDAHSIGLKVYVWTVNDYDDIEKMKLLGVDGMFSNFPDRI